MITTASRAGNDSLVTATLLEIVPFCGGGAGTVIEPTIESINAAMEHAASSETVQSAGIHCLAALLQSPSEPREVLLRKVTAERLRMLSHRYLDKKASAAFTKVLQGKKKATQAPTAPFKEDVDKHLLATSKFQTENKFAALFAKPGSANQHQQKEHTQVAEKPSAPKPKKEKPHRPEPEKARTESAPQHKRQPPRQEKQSDRTEVKKHAPSHHKETIPAHGPVIKESVLTPRKDSEAKEKAVVKISGGGGILMSALEEQLTRAKERTLKEKAKKNEKVSYAAMARKVEDEAHPTVVAVISPPVPQATALPPSKDLSSMLKSVLPDAKITLDDGEGKRTVVNRKPEPKKVVPAVPTPAVPRAQTQVPPPTNPVPVPPVTFQSPPITTAYTTPAPSQVAQPPPQPVQPARPAYHPPPAQQHQQYVPPPQQPQQQPAPQVHSQSVRAGPPTTVFNRVSDVAVPPTYVGVQDYPAFAPPQQYYTQQQRPPQHGLQHTRDPFANSAFGNFGGPGMAFQTNFAQPPPPPPQQSTWGNFNSGVPVMQNYEFNAHPSLNDPQHYNFNVPPAPPSMYSHAPQVMPPPVQGGHYNYGFN
jgi:hypothetical protein